MGSALRDGQVVPVGHPAVLLLHAPLRAGGQVMTKAELLDAAWPKRVVEESNLSVQVAALRKVLGTTSAGGEWISTVARIGYRFAGPFACVDEAGRSGAGVVAEDAAAPPRIAVLPFANLGGDPQQEYFADGITEDVITALLRFRWFSVIGRNASFAFKGRSDATREIATALANVLAYANLFSGDAQCALEAAQRALTIRLDWRPAMETAAYCHAALGQSASAAACREALARMPAPVAADALQPLRKRNPHWVRAVAALARGEAVAF